MVAEPVVRLEGVSKEYQDGQVAVSALSGVTLDIPSGQFVVILGPSGSGKSTLLNILGGIDTATGGKVWVAGYELTGLGEGRLTEYRRTQVGFVFQFFNLVPTLTARENVEMVAELTGQQDRVAWALQTVGLEERAKHFPSQLSGGEQQRVAIARALVKNPPLLLCDEPTGELDIDTGKNILGAIQDICDSEGKTVVLVTHNAAVGQMADRVIRLRNGRLHEDRLNGSPVRAADLEW